MPVLYLVEQGASLRKDGERLRVTKEGVEVTSVPAIKVEQVVIFGNIQVTTPVIDFALRQGIDIVFLSSNGRYYGRLLSSDSKFGELRHRQHHAVSDESLRLEVARAIVRGKLLNQRTLLMRYHRQEPSAVLERAIEGMQEATEKASRAQNLHSLQGYEGSGTALYFGAMKTLLKQNLGFFARQRRPPPDPVNALLSFGYTLLVYSIQSAVCTVGLDPFLGFLHVTEYSRPSLVLDLMEEFRPLIVDSIVLRAVNAHLLTAADFQPSDEPQGGIMLSDDARRRYIQQYEERVQTKVAYHLTGEQATYRRVFELQARQVARLALGQESSYKPMLAK